MTNIGAGIRSGYLGSAEENIRAAIKWKNDLIKRNYYYDEMRMLWKLKPGGIPFSNDQIDFINERYHLDGEMEYSQ